MFKQKIFIYSFIVLVIVAIANHLGAQFNLYYIYPWYDIPMHMLGGLWVSLFTIFLYTNFYNNSLDTNYPKKILKVVLISLLFMTVSWEIFELIGKITFLSEGKLYWIDVIKDIIDGFIGGIIGYYFYTKNTK